MRVISISERMLLYRRCSPFSGRCHALQKSFRISALTECIRQPAMMRRKMSFAFHVSIAAVWSAFGLTTAPQIQG